MIFTKKNYKLKGIFNKEIIHFFLNKNLQKDTRFERIIFHKQVNKSLGIVIHTRNMEDIINKYERENREILYQYIHNKLNTFLIKNQITFKDILLDDISKMNWRASQPIGEAIPERL